MQFHVNDQVQGRLQKINWTGTVIEVRPAYRYRVRWNLDGNGNPVNSVSVHYRTSLVLINPIRLENPIPPPVNPIPPVVHSLPENSVLRFCAEVGGFLALWCFALLLVCICMDVSKFILKYKGFFIPKDVAICSSRMISTMKTQQSRLAKYKSTDIPRRFKELSSNMIFDPSRYYVIIGPIGSGKTPAINHANQNLSMLRLNVPFPTPTDPLLYALSTELSKVFLNDSNLRFHLDVLEEVARSLGAHMGVLVEVGFGVDWMTNRNLALDIKNLCCDTRLCTGILVPSDSYSAFAIPWSDYRARKIWIDDFTVEEAHDFFDRLRFLPPFGMNQSSNEESRKYIFDNYGTQPLDLQQISSMGENYQKCLQEIDFDALRAVRDMVRRKWDRSGNLTALCELRKL